MKYNIEMTCRFGVQVEAKSEEEAKEIGIEELEDKLSETNEQDLGPAGFWLTDSGTDDSVEVSIADDQD